MNQRLGGNFALFLANGLIILLLDRAIFLRERKLVLGYLTLFFVLLLLDDSLVNLGNRLLKGLKLLTVEVPVGCKLLVKLLEVLVGQVDVVENPWL